MKTIKTATDQKGFTLIETVITLVVASIFVIIILNLFMYISSVNSATRAYYNADLLAYNNLRKYANTQSPTWFNCERDSWSSKPRTITLINKTGNVSGIPSPVEELVVAEAPYGCGTEDTSVKPIKITSTVTYGNLRKKISHATYATY